MTNKELIEELLKYPPEHDVVLEMNQVSQWPFTIKKVWMERLDLAKDYGFPASHCQIIIEAVDD